MTEKGKHTTILATAAMVGQYMQVMLILMAVAFMWYVIEASPVLHVG